MSFDFEVANLIYAVVGAVLVHFFGPKASGPAPGPVPNPLAPLHPPTLPSIPGPIVPNHPLVDLLLQEIIKLANERLKNRLEGTTEGSKT